ncbi:hypothetical protein WN48_01227 [Eufriesea mexicana]|uniref:Uncharacterized protein n=1 Tax=Eufriesea mexicana TaxID=516756 RepID=A0A310SGV5_9HYME|nr:hypothetical protein WN48_01227 [Eufriesea mexicana]
MLRARARNKGLFCRILTIEVGCTDKAVDVPRLAESFSCEGLYPKGQLVSRNQFNTYANNQNCRRCSMSRVFLLWVLLSRYSGLYTRRLCFYR